MSSTAADRPTEIAGRFGAQRFLFWLTLLITLGLMINYLLVGDRTWWSACIAVWPPYLWCLGLLPLTACCIHRLRLRYAVILSILVFVFQATTVEWQSLLRSRGATSNAAWAGTLADKDESIALRVVSWNIAAGRSNKSAVLAALSEFSPDLCFLQESYRGSTAIQSSDLTGPWAGFHWINTGDCGLLSRYPIRLVGNDEGHRDDKQQLVEVTLPNGHRLLLVNVHLMMPPAVWNIAFSDHPVPLRAGHEYRVAQYTTLTDRIARHREEDDLQSVILAGDFNVAGDVASLDPIRQRLTDVWQHCGSGWGATIPARLPLARIDHCWVSPDIQPLSARAFASPQSDHRMLVVDLMLAN